MFDIPLRQVKDRLFLSAVPFVPNIISPNHITFIAFVVIVGGIMMIISLHEGTKKDADTSTDTSGMPAIARR